MTLGDTARPTSVRPLVQRIRQLGEGRERVLLGIAGAPGAGKSTLAGALVEALAPDPSVAVPMDGFHLAAEVLAGTELAARRGAADTFDAGGFRDLLARLARRDEDVVYAPRYAREIEDPIASAIPVPRDVRFVVVEGNWLLADGPVWRAARAHLDEVWHVEVDDDLRLGRLIARHVQFGKSAADAHFWSHGSDQVNAGQVGSWRSAADLVVNLQDLDLPGGA